MTSRFRDNCPLDCKVYVGELGTDGSRHELEEAFGYYGPLRNVWVARNPPGFAFVMFQDPRDARDAARALNGKIICGRKVRVELSSGKTRREMADTNGRYGPPRDGRMSPPFRGRSPWRSPVQRGGRGDPHHRHDEPHYRGGRDVPPRRAPRSRSRSRSMSPPPRNRGDLHGNGHGRSRTPISPSRSRSLSKSPEPGRYR